MTVSTLVGSGGRDRGLRLVRDPRQAHREGGEVLADLVVELPGQAPALALLRGELAAGAVPALVLEAVEHLVERPREDRHLGLGPFRRDPAPGAQWVDAAHERREPLERSERAAHEHGVDQRHRDDPAREHDDPPVRGLDPQHDPRGEQHRDVGDQEAPDSETNRECGGAEAGVDCSTSCATRRTVVRSPRIWSRPASRAARRVGDGPTATTRAR
jgi:hypothetical protein